MLSNTTFHRAVCVHEAAYRTAASKLNVKLLPISLRRVGLRRPACNVVDFDADDGSAEYREHRWADASGRWYR